jgi:hypothetical protein
LIAAAGQRRCCLRCIHHDISAHRRIPYSEAPQRFEPLGAFSGGRRPRDLTPEWLVVASKPCATFGILHKNLAYPFTLKLDSQLRRHAIAHDRLTRLLSQITKDARALLRCPTNGMIPMEQLNPSQYRSACPATVHTSNDQVRSTVRSWRRYVSTDQVDQLIKSGLSQLPRRKDTFWYRATGAGRWH